MLLGEGITALNVIPTAGGEARELFRAHQTEVISVPAWMPNSRDIVFARNVTGEKRQFELWRVSADGGKPQNLGLTMRGQQPYGLSIHPDGRQFVFTAGKPPYSEIWGLKDFLPPFKAATPEGK